MEPDFTLVPAWSALFLGLFALFAGIGELRSPGQWQKLLQEIAASPALQVTTALTELTIGALIYVANPWASQDWLAAVLSVIGGLLVLEALAVLAFSDLYLAFWLRRFGALSKLWVLLSIAIGIALIAVSVPRFS